MQFTNLQMINISCICIPRSFKDWFYKLTVHCDNIDINCIIDKRLETKYTSFGSVLGCQDRRGKYVVLSMLFLDITLNQKKNNATILPYSNNIQKLGSSFRVSAQSIEVS
jgi:hypothetical protein